MRLVIGAVLFVVSVGVASTAEIRSLPEFYTSTGFGTIAFNETATNAYQAQQVYKRYNPIRTKKPHGLTEQTTNCYVFNHYDYARQDRSTYVYIRIEKYSGDEFKYNLSVERSEGWIADKEKKRIGPLNKLFPG